MNATIKTLWRTNKLLVIAFAVALAVTLVFAARTTAFYVYWANHRDMPIAGWMPPGYVAKSYGVEIELVRNALGLDPEERDRRPLDRIAADRGVPLDQLIGDLNAAIARAKADEAQKPK